MKLNPYDLKWCTRRLPAKVRNAMKKEELTLAGGFIRSCILNEKVNDIDLFVPTEELGKELAEWFACDKKYRLIETENAFTIKARPYTIQIIHRWLYERPRDVIPDLDYTICQASVWWEHCTQRWESMCCESYYQDLAANRLIYSYPEREEAAGGSLLRVLKYYQKGSRITLSSFAGVISRFVCGVDFEQITNWHDNEREEQLKKVLLGLLYEVDPNLDPDHIIEGLDK